MFLSLRIAYWYKLTQLLRLTSTRPAGAYMTQLASGQALIETLQTGPSHKDTAATRKGSLPLTELRTEDTSPRRRATAIVGQQHKATVWFPGVGACEQNCSPKGYEQRRTSGLVPTQGTQPATIRRTHHQATSVKQSVGPDNKGFLGLVLA
jgi:hypothetical protein